MSVSCSTTQAELSPPRLPFRRIFQWWHHSFYSFRFFWHFALGFLGCSFLDKYFEMIFSRLMSQFSKNALQVAASRLSGRFGLGPQPFSSCGFCTRALGGTARVWAKEDWSVRATSGFTGITIHSVDFKRESNETDWIRNLHRSTLEVNWHRDEISVTVLRRVSGTFTAFR